MDCMTTRASVTSAPARPAMARWYAGGLILLSIATKYERGCEQSTNGSVERALGLGKIVQGGY
jgi:hypothetical protein